MPTIPLTQGYEALVDAADLPIVASYSWFAHKNSAGKVYAATAVYPGGGRRVFLRMHRLLTSAAPGQPVDHRNGDGLDNRRDNLRICTVSQNMQNSRAKRAEAGLARYAPYKGVTCVGAGNRRRPWRAQIDLPDGRRYLGYHATADDAARAYDVAAVEHFGEFARVNFPAAEAAA